MSITQQIKTSPHVQRAAMLVYVLVLVVYHFVCFSCLSFSEGTMQTNECMKFSSSGSEENFEMETSADLLIGLVDLWPD